MHEKITQMSDWLDAHPSYAKPDIASPFNVEEKDAEVISLGEYKETTVKNVHDALQNFEHTFIGHVARNLNAMNSYVRFIKQSVSQSHFRADKYQLWLNISPEQRQANPLLTSDEQLLFTEIDTAIEQHQKQVLDLIADAIRWRDTFVRYDNSAVALTEETYRTVGTLISGLEVFANPDLPTLGVEALHLQMQIAFHRLGQAQLAQHLKNWPELYNSPDAKNSA